MMHMLMRHTAYRSVLTFQQRCRNGADGVSRQVQCDDGSSSRAAQVWDCVNVVVAEIQVLQLIETGDEGRA